MIAYNLTTSSNWQQLWSGNYTAQPVELNVLERYYPIPEIQVNVQLDKHILACLAHSPSSPPNWKFAGRAYFKLETGITVVPVPETVFSVKKIWLQQISLLFVPKLSTSYALSFKIPYWIRDIQLIVWEYTGPVNDSLALKLDEIQSDLTTLQNDFDVYTGMAS